MHINIDRFTPIRNIFSSEDLKIIFRMPKWTFIKALFY